uniref:ZP domain-containing protein n=1 Tax=Dicentrarchus labrax TaxID=13489 RepID=A0A8P4GGB3_DICLA
PQVSPQVSGLLCTADTTSCESCHPLARCHTSLHDNSVEIVGVSCHCEGGMVGDGFTCYNKTTCDDGCCSQGYRWSPLQGCVDIDECLLPRLPCGPGQLCENTGGSFTCLVATPDPQSQTATRTKPRSVKFACGGTQCPFGQDCLQVNGTSQCIDPCQHYSPLQDDWRATDFRVDPESVACDSRTDWQGWYRLFIGNNSVQMPERCIESHMCGTDAPLWLQSPHPLDSEGIVRANVCGSWEGDCCQFQSNLIHVKACPRNYYVYKFVSPTLCRLAYCTLIPTMPFSCVLLCVSDELGGFPEPELDCGQDHLRLMVQKRLLEERGLNASSAHLIDPRCQQQVDHQEAMWYLVERRKSVCGNVVKVTFIGYPACLPYLTLLLYIISDILSAHKVIDANMLALLALSLRGAVGVVRSGDPTRALMTLYMRPDFNEPFPAGAVSLPLGSALHVGVSMENYDNNDFVLLLENCYVTNSPGADDPVRTSLIQDRCPVDRHHVTVVESGLSQRARFSALLFLYQGTYEDVYLHCRISLCDRDSATCSPNCSRRRSRSAASPNQLPVSVGPISCEYFL